MDANVEGMERNINPEPLKGQELDRALEGLRTKAGLSPATTNRLLSIETAEAPGLSNLDKVIPAALMVGYIATFAATRLAGGEFPTAEIPPVLHEMLQAVHNLSNNAANNPTLREHLPFLFLEAAAVWGAVKTLPDWFRSRGKRQRIKEAQQVSKSEIEKGEFNFDMAPGHTAAFVGAGDPLADRLQTISPPDQFIQYSHAKIDGKVWQLLRQNAQQEEIFKVFDRGDLKDAGEILLMPVKYEDMFLPDKTGHDMTIDEVASMVNVVDEYCQSRGIPRKKVVIVGSKDMQETYVRRTAAGGKEESQKTLAELVAEMNHQREGVNVELIDPTEIVMKKITQLAGGRTIEFVSTGESDERYGQRFYERLKSAGYHPNSPDKARILYNITDVPTQVQAGRDDIAVILDPSKKQSLINRGLPEESIIVVPDLTLQVLSGTLDL